MRGIWSILAILRPYTPALLYGIHIPRSYACPLTAVSGSPFPAVQLFETMVFLKVKSVFRRL